MNQLLLNALIPQVKSVGDYDAEAQRANLNALALQQGQLKADEYARSVKDANALRDAYRQFGADHTQNAGKLSAAGVNPQPYLKSVADTGEQEAKATNERIKAVSETLKTYRTAYDSVTTPQQAEQLVRAQYADPVIGQFVQSTAGPIEQSLARIPTDPGQFREYVAKNAMGLEKIASMLKVNQVDQGNQTSTQLVNPVTGEAKTIASASVAQSPNNAATNARLAADAAAGRAQAEQHFQAGQNAPQYMETDQGLVALPKKLKAGEQPVGVPVTGAGGVPLGKPLKDIPPTVNTAIITNKQSANQIDRALTLLAGKDVGTQKGDADATGVKGYLPNGILARVDPQGVDARAEVADIGSLKIHDRSGAAVTISESPRLMPFIPLATDDADTVKKKLRRLKLEIGNESQALSATYSKEQGYKPSPVAAQSQSIKSGTDLGGGFTVK